MATIAPAQSGVLRSAVGGLWRCLRQGVSLSLRTLLVAPAIAALAVLPEFAQHVAEVKLGMFESREAFRALANDPTRWAFGYVKIAGLVAAMLLTARYWASGSVRAAILIPRRDLGRLAVALALLVGSAEALAWLGRASGQPLVEHGLTALVWISQLPLMVMVAGALLGEGEGWRTRLLERLPTALLMGALAAALCLPLQALHSANHMWAFGQPAAALWALMLFDSLVVGWLATAAGATLWVAYRAGPTWRGWSRDPRALD